MQTSIHIAPELIARWQVADHPGSIATSVLQEAMKRRIESAFVECAEQSVHLTSAAAPVASWPTAYMYKGGEEVLDQLAQMLQTPLQRLLARRAMYCRSVESAGSVQAMVSSWRMDRHRLTLRFLYNPPWWRKRFRLGRPPR